MGKVLYRVGGVVNWLAYVWLVTSEAFDEICHATIGDSLRGIVSEAETRKYAPRGAAHNLYQSTAAQGSLRQ
jgi:hypothetical protein